MKKTPFHNPTARALQRWLSALTLAIGILSAQAQFRLVDNFQAATLGDLNGQNGWTATAGIVLVEADAAQPANKVASFGAGAASGYLPVSIPEGTTGTLFFRAYAVDPASLDWFAGMSDVAISGLGAFANFETQVGVAGFQSPDKLKVRDGSTGANVDVEAFLPETWYKVWVVVDNAADQYEVYVQGGALTAQTQVDRDDTGATAFVFRNSGAGPAANDLIRFFALTTTSQTQPMLLDDVYLATGRNLTDPTTSVPPLSVRITSPAEGTGFPSPADITVTATALGGSGTISRMEFFAGTNLIGTATSSPFTVTWRNVPAGAHVLTAKATDNAGASGTSAPVAINVVAVQQGPFVLVDNFQAANLGDLNGQNGWTATAGVVLVEADPTAATNKVAGFGGGAASGYLPVSIPEGQTATLFYRAFSPEDTIGLDWFAGMSDVAITGTGVFGDFETQVGVAGAQSHDKLKLRDGSAGNVDSEEFLPQTWYKFWVVIDNAADRYEVFMQGGSLTSQTQVDRDNNGSTSFVFRNSAAAPAPNNLIRFFALSSGSHFSPMLLDDLYLASGRNLTDPTSGGEAPLRLEFSRQGREVTLTWQGTATLQSSTQVATGYTDVAGAQSPFKVDTATAGSPRFYRLRR